MHGLISRRKAYATGRINQITTFLPTRPQADESSGVLSFSELKSIDAIRLSAVTLPVEPGLRQYYLHPLALRDQREPRMTLVSFSRAALWCRFEWRRVKQLNQTKTYSQAIDIQYHSDKDTTTLSVAESLHFRLSLGITTTSCHNRDGWLWLRSKSCYRRFAVLSGRIKSTLRSVAYWMLCSVSFFSLLLLILTSSVHNKNPIIRWGCLRTLQALMAAASGSSNFTLSTLQLQPLSEGHLFAA